MGLNEADGENPEDGFTHQDPVVDEALEWFGRLRDATPDAATLAAFDSWLARSPRHAAEFRNLEEIWGGSSFYKAAERLPAGHHAVANDGTRRHAVASPSRRGSMRMAMAASVALAVIGAWQAPSLILRWQADYQTSAGMQSTITLPDGSTMMLNTASAVAIDFANGRRNVRLLEGEAYFDVRRDPDHLFRVAGHFGDVEVKGTAFSVRADDKEDRVVLERGRVDVQAKSGRSDEVVLKPGQMAVATAMSLSTEQVDPAAVLAWRGGRVVFENQPFSKVLRELRRYYSGPVVVMTDRVNDLPVTGNYRIDNVEGAFKTLADAAGVTMNRLPGGIILLR
ncbi:FecR family protein [Bradyrhizobium sp.]|uniref:FecR family protein n=1 Tax=Bradyrhizobium sp. TaxID=376 RepID=UPI0039E729CB